ncbi:MAG: PilX N-terminal domain-containing pilus assembly protein [Gammaproteobacteria bacterium]
MKLPAIARRRFSVLTNQRGAALLIGLIMLVLLTLLGVTGMQTTAMQERMAGNMRDRDLALQAAEAALRGAERVLQGASLPDFDGSDCYYPTQPYTNAPLHTTVSWTTSSAQTCAVTTALAAIAEQPRYLIEALPPIPASGTGGSSKFGALADVGVYRVTARGVGGTAAAVVMLEATFRR